MNEVIEYDSSAGTVGILASYKEKSKQKIPAQNLEKIEKYCDKFFDLISEFLKEDKYHGRDDLNTAMNIFLYSINGNFDKLSMQFSGKDDFKSNFKSFVFLLDTFNCCNKKFLEIGFVPPPPENYNYLDKLMTNTLKDIASEVSSADFIINFSSKKNSKFTQECEKACDKRLLEDIFIENKFDKDRVLKFPDLNMRPASAPRVTEAFPSSFTLNQK